MPQEVFEFIQSVGAIASIFLKNKQGLRSYLYANECELRMAFEMDEDQEDYVYIEGKGLAGLIEEV